MPEDNTPAVNTTTTSRFFEANARCRYVDLIYTVRFLRQDEGDTSV